MDTPMVTTQTYKRQPESVLKVETKTRITWKTMFPEIEEGTYSAPPEQNLRDAINRFNEENYIKRSPSGWTSEKTEERSQTLTHVFY